MKKLLLITLLFAIYITLAGQTNTKIYPKDFCGITNKSNVFAKQTLANNIIIGNYNGSIGRAYFEFDLAAIPSNAKITYAAIRLQPKAGQYTNFGGKVRLERVAEGITDANATNWNLIKTIGNSGDYLGTECEFQNSSVINFLGESFLPAHIQDRIGKKVAFMINHKNEQNQVVYLSGNKLDLYLDVSYTPTPPPSTGGGNQEESLKGLSIMGPDMLTFNSTGTFIISSFVGNVQWTVNENNMAIIGNSYINDVKTKAKEVASPSVYIRASKAGVTLEKNIAVISPINVTSSFITSLGGTVSYNILGLPTSAKVTWTANSNCTLLQGQGTGNTSFQAAANGVIKVTAEIKYNNSVIILTNSDIWVGAPPKFTLSSFPFECGTAGRIGINTGTFGYSEKALAESSVSWKVGGTDASLCSQTKSSCMAFCRWSNNISVDFTITNNYGTSISNTHYPVTSGNCPFPSDPGKKPIPIPGREKSVLVDEDQPEIKSVKVYNLSGVLVYSDNSVNGNFDIRSTVLTNGIYIIEKFDGENRTSEKVILKR